MNTVTQRSKGGGGGGFVANFMPMEITHHILNIHNYHCRVSSITSSYSTYTMSDQDKRRGLFNGTAGAELYNFSQGRDLLWVGAT